MNQPDPELKRQVFIRFALAPILLGAVFFLPAGTWDYWQAWVYIGIICFPVLMVVLYFLKKDPEFLERRLHQDEHEKEQKLIVKLGNFLYLLLFLLPGFDRRFHWSTVPAWLVMVSEIMVVLGYGLIVVVFRENRFASRTIEVMSGQSVIQSGPYAVIRHPMYLGTVVMLLFSPLALGSYWALLALAAVIPLLVWRIRNEEHILRQELAGYADYQQKVKYRLLPYLW